ncbi:WxL domain-containing protein [Brochothrix thermosphacta]|uniref:WxL domain-containing protein n=1 Tax=Brochothrix thermosphacta TaxID=2756 RepID=UPI00083FBB7C|nr:WxL domain-containing protein [Brochothrix thermosphacta]ODJ70995.1 hypothetical protein BFR43_03800 [Brochothrix thermosphacta]
MIKTKQFGKALAIGAILSAGVIGGTTAAYAAEGTDGGEYSSNAAVKFIPNTDPTKPIDPEGPGPGPVLPIDPIDPGGPNPGTDGPLSIDFASSLQFGTQKIVSTDVTYYAYSQQVVNPAGETITKPNYVQVSDNRGSAAGWNLTVKQDGEFTTAEDVKNKTLKGSMITLDGTTAYTEGTGSEESTVYKGLDLIPGESVQVMSAAKNQGEGIWVARFGSSDSDLKDDANSLVEVDGEMVEQTINKNHKVSLLVPGKIAKSAASYKTKLIWTLSEVAGNEEA